MCLQSGVGRGAKNLRADVRTVQLLVNLHAPALGDAVAADGVCGDALIASIEAFQGQVVGDRDPRGVVPANGTTLAALRAGMSAEFALMKMEAVFVDAAAEVVQRFYQAILDAMRAGGIDSALRQAHFLAQVAHESGELRYTQELASGAAYEGRNDLGNTQAGDGVRFKGRGLIQITGRANYAAFGKAVGQDFLTNERWLLLATDAAWAVASAVWFWNTHGLNTLADADDVTAITRKINGGVNGLVDRKAKLERAKFFLVSPGAVSTLKAVAEEKSEEKSGARRKKRQRKSHHTGRSGIRRKV